MRLTVRDDGEPVHASGVDPGYGLVGMTERAALLGGTLAAGPGPDRGWVVDAVLPRAGREGPAEEGRPLRHPHDAVARIDAGCMDRLAVVPDRQPKGLILSGRPRTSIRVAFRACRRALVTHSWAMRYAAAPTAGLKRVGDRP